MKQTNNAIKFLMAQYRAIFKNANIAMVAAMAAAALSAGAANAATPSALEDKAEWNKALTSGDGTITITGTSTDQGANGKFQHITVSGASTPVKLKLDANQKLVVSDVTSAITANTIKAGGASDAKLVISGSGDIEINGVSKGTDLKGLTIEADSGSVVVDVNKLTVNTNLVIKSSADEGSVASVSAKTITIGDNAFKADEATKVEGLAKVNVGDATGSGSITFGSADSEILINKDGRLAVTAISGAAAGEPKAGAHVLGKSLTVNGGVVSFESGAASGKSVYGVQNTVLKGGILNVKDGSLTTVDLGDAANKISLTSGSHLVLAGNLGVDKGTIEVGSDSVLAASANTGKVTLGTDGTQGDDIAVLKISSKQLGSFLTGKVGDAALKYKNEANIYDANTDNDLANAATGILNLKSGGTVELTDTDSVDIATNKAFAFHNSAAAGKIHAEAGTIKGAKLTVSKSLTNASAVEIAAKELTLGSSEFDGTAALGVGNFWAENVTLVKNKSKEEFLLQDKLQLENAAGGKIKGSVNVSGTMIEVMPGSKFTLADNANLTITSGAASSNNVGLKLDEASLTVSGKLTTAANGKIQLVGGTLDASKVTDYKVAASSILMEEASTLILNGSKIINLKDDKTKVTFDPDKFAATAVSGNGLATINLANIGSMTMKQFDSLQTQTGFTGLFDGFNITEVGDSVKPSLNLTDVKPGTPANVYHNTQVTVGTDGISEKSYSMGSIALSGTKSLEIKAGAGKASLVKLTNAGANGNTTGRFIQTSDNKIGGVTFSGSNVGLVLEGNGSIGAVLPKNENDGALIIGSIDGKTKGHVTVKGNIGSPASIGTLQVGNGSALAVTGGKVRTHELFIKPGASLNASKAEVSVVGDTSNEAYSEIFGDLNASAIYFAGKGEHIIANQANVKVDTFKGSSNAVIRIGQEGENGLGATVITGTLDLNGGTLIVDPDLGKEASYKIVADLADAANNINGKIVVGNNAVTAFGYTDKASVQEVVGKYLDANGSFKADSKIKNALVLNTNIEVGTGSSLTIDPKATAAGSNAVTFGKDSALIVTDEAIKDGKSAINITSNSKVVDAQNGGTVVLSGKFKSGDTYTIFEGATTFNGELDVTSANGWLNGKIGANGKIENLELNYDTLDTQMAGVSAPVRELFANILGKDSDKYLTGPGVGADFLFDVGTNSNTGIEADAAAHAATYAGAQQAAVAAVTTMADAMFGRVGAVGVEAASISATGSQANGGVWLTPMYKSVDADGFNAQGASYGADVDLGGVAFGADTVNGNMRFGAVFNIGSGDSEGKGNGNGLKDDFDYYGFGIYSAMGFGNFALVGDASLTVISHEVEGLNLRGKADTTAVTMGVTGQYTFATPAVDVTPHLGARFIRLNTDSYDLISAKGVVATTDFDVQNVFSVPVGVTLSKGFVAGGWSLAPSADLTVAFNTGDTEAKSQTTFTGVKGINLSTEVLDEVQYGVNLGLGAQYGAFGTSFGINYTGSSNTNSFGVNAQARYMF